MSAAPAQIRDKTRRVPAHAVLLIGTESLEREIGRLFASSHWMLVREASLESALQLVESARIPVVFCEDAEVRRIEAALSKLHPRPVVIALSTNDGLGAGIYACGGSAFLMNVHRIAAGEWFSLLNHAWRSNNERGCL